MILLFYYYNIIILIFYKAKKFSLYCDELQHFFKRAYYFVRDAEIMM